MTDISSQPSPQGAADAQPGPVEDVSFGVFSADTGHELANLMMVATGSLEQLRRQPLDHQGQRQLARAEWGVWQAARLMRQALPQPWDIDDTAAVVDLNAVVSGFASVMEQQAYQGVHLTVELAPGRLPVRLDTGLLELVLLNLVRNAADTMPDGGKVVLRTQGPQLDGLGNRPVAEVAVSDSGMGMLPDAAQRTTEAVFTTTPHGQDTGLGLWMAQNLASTHDGKISIETAPGQGTTVRLSLPYVDCAKES